MAIILAYHFNLHHPDNDTLDHNNHKLKFKHISCEGGACDEKNDHTHELKRKKRHIDKTIHYSHK